MSQWFLGCFHSPEFKRPKASYNKGSLSALFCHSNGSLAEFAACISNYFRRVAIQSTFSLVLSPRLRLLLEFASSSSSSSASQTPTCLSMSPSSHLIPSSSFASLPFLSLLFGFSAFPSIYLSVFSVFLPILSFSLPPILPFSRLSGSRFLCSAQGKSGDSTDSYFRT